MTNTVDTSTDESGDSLVTLRRSEIKVLQKKAKERDEFAQELETLQSAKRELAFAKAGIPIDDKRASYFVKGYDGDLEAKAIRSAAEEIGLLQPAQQQDGQTVSPTEQQTHQAIYSASQGAGGPEPTGVEDGMDQVFEADGAAGLMQYLAAQGVPIAED